MRYIKYILLFLIVSETCFSQTIRFNKTFYPFTYQEADNVFEYNDGYVMVGGGIDAAEPGQKIKIIIYYLDSVGDEIWMKTYGDTIYDYYFGERNSLIKNTDGGFSLAGNKVGQGNIACMLTKFDQNFDTLWTRYYFDNPDFTVFYNHIQTDDGGYALVGCNAENDPDGDVLLVKTDSLGNMQWYKKYGTGATDYGFCIVRTPDNGYLIGGISWGYGGGDACLIKTDSLGNEEWTEHYGHPTYPDGNFNDIEKTSDGGYVFATRYALVEIMDPIYHSKYNIIKLDSNYNLLWNKQYGILAEYCGTGSIIEADNGDLLFTVGDYLNNDYRAGLFRLTADGDSIWKQHYIPPAGDDEVLFALKQTPDKGFIMAGVAFDPQQMWVVKVDSCGCDTVGCLCDNIYVEEIKYNENSLLIYPNPAEEYITIEFLKGKAERVEIFDIHGRKVKTFQVKFKSQFQTDVADLPKGLYLVRVYGEGFVEAERVIIE